MPNVITITGPSGSGKSTAFSYFLKSKNRIFKPILIPKYTTRAARDDDTAETLCVAAIPSECDLVYEQYGVRYGFDSQKLFDSLAIGNSPIVILNDVRTVEDVRAALGPVVKSVFVFREGPSLEKYRELGHSRNVQNEEDFNRRFNKAQAIYRIYIENIHLFDHVIINGRNRTALKTQVHKIVTGLSRVQSWPLR
jgi:guanylate kinase